MNDEYKQHKIATTQNHGCDYIRTYLFTFRMESSRFSLDVDESPPNFLARIFFT